MAHFIRHVPPRWGFVRQESDDHKAKREALELQHAEINKCRTEPSSMWWAEQRYVDQVAPSQFVNPDHFDTFNYRYQVYARAPPIPCQPISLSAVTDKRPPIRYNVKRIAADKPLATGDMTCEHHWSKRPWALSCCPPIPSQECKKNCNQNNNTDNPSFAVDTFLPCRVDGSCYLVTPNMLSPNKDNDVSKTVIPNIQSPAISERHGRSSNIFYCIWEVSDHDEFPCSKQEMISPVNELDSKILLFMLKELLYNNGGLVESGDNLKCTAALHLVINGSGNTSVCSTDMLTFEFIQPNEVQEKITDTLGNEVLLQTDRSTDVASVCDLSDPGLETSRSHLKCTTILVLLEVPYTSCHIHETLTPHMSHSVSNYGFCRNNNNNTDWEYNSNDRPQCLPGHRRDLVCCQTNLNNLVPASRPRSYEHRKTPCMELLGHLQANTKPRCFLHDKVEPDRFRSSETYVYTLARKDTPNIGYMTYKIIGSQQYRLPPPRDYLSKVNFPPHLEEYREFTRRCPNPTIGRYDRSDPANEMLLPGHIPFNTMKASRNPFMYTRNPRCYTFAPLFYEPRETGGLCWHLPRGVSQLY